MNVYLIRRIKCRSRNEEYQGFVVVAQTAEDARAEAQVAALPGGEWEAGIWTDPSKSTCEIVDLTKKDVVLVDYAEG